MKLTKSKLQQIIKEELESILQEQPPTLPNHGEGDPDDRPPITEEDLEEDVPPPSDPPLVDPATGAAYKIPRLVRPLRPARAPIRSKQFFSPLEANPQEADWHQGAYDYKYGPKKPGEAPPPRGGGAGYVERPRPEKKYIGPSPKEVGRTPTWGKAVTEAAANDRSPTTTSTKKTKNAKP